MKKIVASLPILAALALAAVACQGSGSAAPDPGVKPATVAAAPNAPSATPSGSPAASSKPSGGNAGGGW